MATDRPHQDAFVCLAVLDINDHCLSQLCKTVIFISLTFTVGQISGSGWLNDVPKVTQQEGNKRNSNSDLPTPTSVLLPDPLAAHLAHKLALLLCKCRTPVNEGGKAFPGASISHRDLEVRGSPLLPGKEPE